MKLKAVYAYKGKVTLITGLAIRGAGSELSIGGADSEVIKNPITGEPYIPGSSLKGKMRSQLERVYGAKNKKGEIELAKPCGCGQCDICRIFGAHMNPDAESAPTRIIVRDSVLSEKCRLQIADMPLEAGNSLELKAENMIKRNSGTAEAPRFMERVPAGMEFNVEIMLQVFDKDNAESMKKLIEEGGFICYEDILSGKYDDELLYSASFDDEFCTVTLNLLEREFVKNCITGNLSEDSIIIKRLNEEDTTSFEHIQRLDKAIRNNQKVELIYKIPRSIERLQGELRKIEMFPVALAKFVDKNIYYAVEIKEEKIIHYRVDRIQSIKILKEKKIYSEIDLKLLSKFEYMWSTESEGEPFGLKLRVTKEAGVYQRMKEELQYRKYGYWEEDENYYYYLDKVIGSTGLKQWIRKYGKSVMVMEPIELSKEIYEAALLKRKMYLEKVSSTE